MPLSLVQKRVLLAAANNVHKKEVAYTKAFESKHPSLRSRLSVARSKWHNAREVLEKLEKKFGVNGHTINYHLMSKNVIANVIKKHKLAGPLIARAQDKIWRRGHEAEMERARANFRNFAKGVFHQKINLIGESHRKKNSSPPKQVTPRRTSPPPANNAHRRVHGIGPANNTRITWSRNANGKINRFKTLENINLKLSQAERNAVRNMSENQAIKYIRNLARK